MKTKGGALALALALALAGCGGGGGEEAEDDPTLTPNTANRDDAAVAADANLTLADFPTEWRSSAVPAATSQAAESGARALAECMNRPPPEEIRTAIAYSDDFNAQEIRRVSSSVQVVRTEELAEDDFAALRTDQALTCHKAQIDAEFARQLPAEASPQTAIERLDLPQFADETVAYRITATTLERGAQVRRVIDLVFVRKGRVEAAANFLNVNSPFPSDLQRTLLQRMAARL
ncbi:MAG: hypothetical protein ACLGI2_05650 [Acidimicrobiia bacterium]